MRGFGPRALTPHDGWSWLVLAWQLLWRRPWLFVAVALFAPGGSALLLASLILGAAACLAVID